jgi:hypothetical protein
LILIPILAVFAVCLIAYTQDRFRYPIEPFLVLIGSQGMVEVYQFLKRNSGVGKRPWPPRGSWVATSCTGRP